MNTSIGDSHNLGKSSLVVMKGCSSSAAAWKLALAVKGYASLELLKTVRTLVAAPYSDPSRLLQYEFERRAVAQELIGFDKWFAEGFSSRARAKVVEGNGDVLPGPLE